jgi:hypothetical protein
LDNAQTHSVRSCFERIFQSHGLPEAIRSDNGVPFASTQGLLGLTRLSAWWVVLGIDLERGRPGCPQDNGGHERLHSDIRRELQAEGVETQAVLDQWRQSFNQERPHEALSLRCPAEVYAPSERPYQLPDDLAYEGMEQRKVNNVGCICWHQESIFISGALSGWSVGLQWAETGKWKVWFGRLLLGEIDPMLLSFSALDQAEQPHEK